MVYNSDADAGTAGTLDANQGDDVNNFTTDNDGIQFGGDFATANMSGTDADGADAVTNAGGIDQNDTDGGGDVNVVQVIAGAAGNTATAADLLDLTELNVAAGTLANGAGGDEFIFIFNSNDGNAAVYKFTDDANVAAIEAGELQLLGLFDSNISAADDISFA